MSEPDVTLIAVAVVQHEGRVLVGPRPRGVPLAGCWEFPGGKVAPGERPEQAAARECREETGLAVEIGGELADVLHDYAHGRVRLRFFAAVPADPVAAPADPFRWVPVSELADYAFPPANETVIEKLRSLD